MTERNHKLVSPAIVRKLDHNLPGTDETRLDLEEVPLPRFQVGFPPQRLTMTLLGEFWERRTEAIPSAALVRLLGAFDINEQAARVALGRLAARSALIMDRRGRTTWYRQSPRLLTILPQGRAVTEGFGEPRSGWDGTWTLVTWTVAGSDTAAAASHRVRTNLRELGFAPLTPGVWVSPDCHGNDELSHALAVEGDVRFTVFTAADTSFPGATSPRSAWNVEEMRPEYDNFLGLFSPSASPTPGDPIDPEAALVTRIRAVYRWFAIATLDPDLPVEMLPADWPRAAARRLFVDVVDRMTPQADAYVPRPASSRKRLVTCSRSWFSAALPLPSPVGGRLNPVYITRRSWVIGGVASCSVHDRWTVRSPGSVGRPILGR
jgi:phenylacetic acid degradation operon negative regulatory protein